MLQIAFKIVFANLAIDNAKGAGQEAEETRQKVEGRVAFESVRRSSSVNSKETELPNDSAGKEHKLIDGQALYVSVDTGRNESRARCINPGECDKETLCNIRKMYRKLSPKKWGQRNPIGIKFYRVMHPQYVDVIRNDSANSHAV